jgi:DNA polymerase-3 subunit delta'
MLKSLGVNEGDAVPPNLRVDIKNLEEAQKRRAARSLRDGIDRILVDLLALYRDILTVQLQAQANLVNEDLRATIEEVAGKSNPAQTIAKLDAISQARTRLESNGRDIYILDALAVALRNNH